MSPKNPLASSFSRLFSLRIDGELTLFVFAAVKPFEVGGIRHFRRSGTSPVFTCGEMFDHDGVSSGNIHELLEAFFRRSFEVLFHIFAIQKFGGVLHNIQDTRIPIGVGRSGITLYSLR